MFDLHVLWADSFVTTSPKHLQTILATDFANFQKGTLSSASLEDPSLEVFKTSLGPWFQDSMNSVLGTGVFNADGMFL